ncbi:hypothetical protein BC835DRAFT_488158 [Cytidiella melzeri]|nr:hypothetical protein BC835DRAFT_488158 [Cytidiella melzeri]
MAPIPTTAELPNMPALPALSSPWIMWLVVILLTLSGVALLAWAVYSVFAKVRTAIRARNERQEADKMVLPTHLDSYAPRVVILPLPSIQGKEVGEEQGHQEKVEMEEVQLHQSMDIQSAKEETLAVTIIKTEQSPPRMQYFLKLIQLPSIFAPSCTTPEAEQPPSSKSKKSKPSWIARLYNRMMIATHMVPSPTMDLPMQMPEPGWEDEIEFPREDPPNINNNDELYCKAMRRMLEPLPRKVEIVVHHPPEPEDEDIDEKDIIEALAGIEEDEIGHCSLLQPPSLAMSSRSSDTLGEILGYYAGRDDSADHLVEDTDTPALSSVTDTSDDDEHGSPLGTPPLIDGLPFVDVLPLDDLESTEGTDTGLGNYSIVEVQDDILAADAKPCTEDVEDVEQYSEIDLSCTEEVDQIDTLIAAVTGYTPRKLVLDVDSLVQSPEQMSPTEEEELDDIDATIASVTGYSPRRNSSLSTPPSARRPLSHRPVFTQIVSPTTSPQRLPSSSPNSPSTGTPSRTAHTGVSTWDNRLSGSMNLSMSSTLSCTPGSPAVPRSSPVNTSPGISAPHWKPWSLSRSVDTPTKPRQLSAHVMISSRATCRPLPRPMSAPVLPSLPRTISKRFAASGSGQSKATHRPFRVVSSPPAVSVDSRAHAPPPQSSTSKAPPPLRFSTSSHSQAKVFSTRNTVVAKSSPTANASAEPPRPSSGPTAPTASSTNRKSLTKSVSTTTMPPKSASPPAAQSTKRFHSSRKLLVTFDPTPTPSPQARAMWRSYSPQPSIRMKPVVGDRPTRCWKP